ncbi:hypothetical protein N7454_001483 [Penicillium verhagenii]|nr:hypothetical protein N7454_001483 [Penicillium verhagenii]
MHLALLATRDFTLEVWEDTGFHDLAGLDMDQVFRETRNVHSTLWGQEYPAEEIVDDMSVLRPLELYHECNKFKSKMIRVFQGSKSFTDHPISHKALHDELEQIGKAFRDLITLAKRTDFPMRRRELHTSYLAVAEYHALSLMCEKALCVSEPRPADPLKELISVSKKVVQQDSRTAVRLSWAFLIAAEWSEDDTHRKWLEEALGRAHHETGWTKFEIDKHRGTPPNLWNLV